MTHRWTMATMAVALFVGTAAAGQQPERQDQHLDGLTRCRTIAQDAARLACFDQEVMRVQQAIDRKDLMVVDRGDVQETQRSLFGITAPHVRLFDKLGSADLDHLDTVVTSATIVGEGRLRFTVSDGAVWEQSDDYPVAGIRPGRKVTFTRGALGTFFAKFEKGQSIRARRLH